MKRKFEVRSVKCEVWSAKSFILGYRLVLLVVLMCGGSLALAGQTVVVVTGAPGSAEFGERFETWADQWARACETANVDCIEIGRGPTESSDRDALGALLADPAIRQAQDALWLVLIGHGTFDGRAARFNLRGPDVTDR
ncbi:MAG: hypothetical protein GY809_15730, partial [Planctomycetes bacterium]|nr:hypothetical protein [Planctomycetota bacterium]